MTAAKVARRQARRRDMLVRMWAGMTFWVRALRVFAMVGTPVAASSASRRCAMTRVGSEGKSASDSKGKGSLNTCNATELPL